MKNEPECPRIDPKPAKRVKLPKKTYGDYRPKLDGKPGDGYTAVSVVAML